MKYIVMECNLSYAVVLDEEGRFFNVANRNYKVGQTTTDVIKMNEPETDTQTETQVERQGVFTKTGTKKAVRWKYLATAVAACLVIVVASVLSFPQGAYASVYMTINPDIRIDISKNETVVDLKGLNKDGETVIEGYDYKKKKVDVVIDELLDRSMEKGFLHEGSKISLSFDGKNGTWVIEKGDIISKHVEDYLNGKVSATVKVEAENHALKADPDKRWNKTTTGKDGSVTGTQGNSDYDDHDYDDDDGTNSGSGSAGNSNYGNTNYGDTNYGDTNYGSTSGGTSSAGGTTGSSTTGGSTSSGTTDSNSGYGTSDYNDVDGNTVQTEEEKAREEAEKKAAEEAAKKAEEEAKAREEAAKKAEEEARKKAEEEEKAREEAEKAAEEAEDAEEESEDGED